MTKKKAVGDKPLVIDYDLFDLPSAQHKAGLAGLLAMIGTMQQRRMPRIPEVVDVTGNTVRISFTKESIQNLFNELYDATLVEVDTGKKWPNMQPKRFYERESFDGAGRKSMKKRYVYDVMQPRGAFLQAVYPDGDGAWLKLWRDMIWGVIRAQDKTRNVYKQRLEMKDCALGADMWKCLRATQELGGTGEKKAEKLSGATLVGAQEFNAERVPFQGQVEHNLLLHFWTIASMVFAPQLHSLDGTVSEVGYVLVIPEPADIPAFVDDISKISGSLERDMVGYRPRASLIDLPEEGGLEYLYHLTRRRVERTAITYSVAAVEIYHLQKRGNSIRLLVSSRIVPNAAMLDRYESLRGVYRNHLFKTLRLRNLLNGSRWHADVDALFGRYPWEFFIYRVGGTPQSIPFFGFDVRRTMASIEQDIKTMGGVRPMTETDQDNALASRIYQLMYSYVNRKAEDKSGEKPTKVRDDAVKKDRYNYPERYREARQKACADAFLAMRSRREADFIEYFVGSVCSVPHFLPEGEYLAVSKALMTDWSRVKNLAMLALSAHSTMGPNREDEKGGMV
ncbi:MAG: type I-MYXAN CRISPR-associated protein Cmx8 [Pseudomonadota bacterium]